MKGKIVIGMSGGVDSSVAAYLLKEQGYDVIGVTMVHWKESGVPDEECPSMQAAADARAVAGQLDIPHYTLDFCQEFKTNVMDYFVSEYLRGRTPNPCTVCNRYVKWEALLKRAGDFGADLVATGHYARIRLLENGRYALCKAAADKKDQTYVLYNLTQEQLARTRMPLGGYDKSQVRKIAEQIGLNVADKPDSQEICFIPDHDYGNFIENYENGNAVLPGNFVDSRGNVLGQHKGIIHYTIGQRKGLGIALGSRAFVTRICPDTNEVVLGENEDLFCHTLYASDFNWMGAKPPKKQEQMRVTGKIRYTHKGADCTVSMTGDGLVKCEFDQPQRAITPGQSVVLYDGDIVLGGGVITAAG